MSMLSRYTAFLSILIVLVAAGVAIGADNPPVFDVPYLKGISIDGDRPDWGNRGFRVGIMSLMDKAKTPSYTDFCPSFRVGWNESGILFLSEVRDSSVKEAEIAADLTAMDSVTVWVNTAGPKPDKLYGLAVSTGADPRFRETRTTIWDQRTQKDTRPELTVNAVAKPVSGGYMVEILLPWKNLGITPREGMEFGIQVGITDADEPGNAGHDRISAFWNTEGSMNSHSPLEAMRLSDHESPPVLAVSTGKYENCSRLTADILAAPELIGKTLTVRSHSGKSVNVKVAAGTDGWGVARIRLPLDPKSGISSDPVLRIGKGPVGVVKLPVDDFRLNCVRALEKANLRFDPYVFSGTEFPKCEFEQPLLAEQILGTYSIQCAFYDKDYNVVAKAETPGRYGAMVEIIPDDGSRVIRRHCTLFRQPEPIEWWNQKLDISVTLPSQLGINPAVLSESKDVVADMVKWHMVDSFGRDGNNAKILAGLFENQAEMEMPVLRDPRVRDRQWWVELKRRLYGTEKLYPGVFLGPKPKEGSPAPILHEGSLMEAGMKPDAVEKIDGFLQQWATNTDEAFAVLIARHGVIVLHKAYGIRDARPMTTETKSWMASITKCLSANLMMMLVDQGLVDLDATVDTYLPALRDIDVKTPLTVRHLYTHTGGFDYMEHWGDEMNDLEEVIAGYYPYLQIGESQSYNGVGYAIGGKIVETISGESIPVFYKKHLLEPLACANTDVKGTYGDAYSVPMDIAKIAQMMLNKGAYGNMRFYSEDTYSKMLPVRLDKILGPDTQVVWGIGTMGYHEPSLSSSAFCHGAASCATLRVDPVNDLVIVMTRNAGGKDFWDYQGKFVEAITGSMDTVPGN